MNLGTLSLAVLLLVPAGAACAQQAPPVTASRGSDARLQNMDSLLAQAQEAAAQVDAMAGLPQDSFSVDDIETLSNAAQRNLDRKCRADFSLEAVEKDVSAFPLNDGRTPISTMIDSIRHYYECRAFTQHKPQLCEALPRYQPSNQPDDYVARCRTSYVRFRVIQLNAARRPDAAKACMTLPLSADDLYETNLREECAWMTDPRPDAHCKAPISPALDTIDIKDCLAHHVLHASPANCAAIQEAPTAEVTRSIYHARCRDALAYRLAYQSHDIGRCGGSAVCRMLMGENVCGQHLEKFKEAFCSFWTRENLKKEVDLLSAQQEVSRRQRIEAAQELLRRRSQVQVLLAQLGEMVENFEPKSQPDYISRRDHYRSLRKRIEGSLRSASSAAGTKGKI